MYLQNGTIWQSSKLELVSVWHLVLKRPVKLLRNFKPYMNINNELIPLVKVNESLNISANVIAIMSWETIKTELIKELAK